MRLESSCKAAHLSIENFFRDTFKSGKDNVVMLQIWLSSYILAYAVVLESLKQSPSGFCGGFDGGSTAGGNGWSHQFVNHYTQVSAKRP